MRYLQMLFAVSAIGLFAVACGGQEGDEVMPTGDTQAVSVAGTCNCPAVVAPVCGEDGKTYGNSCEAECEGVKVAYEGACRCNCPAVIDPVCGVDGKEYGNSCEAACAGVEIDYDGPCKDSVK